MLTSTSQRLHEIHASLGTEVPWGDGAHLPAKLCLSLHSDAVCGWIAVLYSLLVSEAQAPDLCFCSGFPHKQPLRLNPYASRREEESVLFLSLSHRGPWIKSLTEHPRRAQRSPDRLDIRGGREEAWLHAVSHVSEFIHSLSVDEFSALNLGWGCLHAMAVAYTNPAT